MIFIKDLINKKILDLDCRNNINWLKNIDFNKSEYYNIKNFNESNILKKAILHYDYCSSLKEEYIEVFLKENNYKLLEGNKEEIDKIFPEYSDFFYQIQEFINNEVLHLKLNKYIIEKNSLKEGIKKFYRFNLNIEEYCGNNFGNVLEAFDWYINDKYNFLEIHNKDIVMQEIHNLNQQLPRDFSKKNIESQEGFKKHYLFQEYRDIRETI